MNEVIMELKNITKYFPGVVALDNMSFTVRKGMVHGLIGDKWRRQVHADQGVYRRKPAG